MQPEGFLGCSRHSSFSNPAAVHTSLKETLNPSPDPPRKVAGGDATTVREAELCVNPGASSEQVVFVRGGRLVRLPDSSAWSCLEGSGSGVWWPEKRPWHRSHAAKRDVFGKPGRPCAPPFWGASCGARARHQTPHSSSICS